MNKTHKYTYLVTMPAKCYYDYGYGHQPYTYDIISNPEGEYEKDALNRFWRCYGDDKWCEKSRYIDKPIIKRLMSTYGYSFSHTRRHGIRDGFVFIELEITTDALGTHLLEILECIDSDFSRATNDSQTHAQAAGYDRRGWQGIDPENLADCKHPRSKRLEIMKDKDGTIVEVRECSKCKKLFKLAIH